MNKDVRSYREFIARRTSHLYNLTNVFNNLFIHSDGVIHHIVDKTSSLRDVPEKLTCMNEDGFILSTIIV